MLNSKVARLPAAWLQGASASRCLHDGGSADRGSRSNPSSPVHRAVNNTHSSRSVTNTSPKWSIESSGIKLTQSAPATVQSFQGGQHEFAKGRARDVMDRDETHLRMTTEERADAHAHSEGVQDVPDRNKIDARQANYGDAERMDSERMRIYDSSCTVSLHSCMQSMVPEPFNPNGRNPSHLNMPGGNILRSQKYLYGDIHSVHPTRTGNGTTGNGTKKFSTYSALMSQALAPKEASSGPTLQGIQGEDCARFDIWFSNCQRFNLNCDEQLKSLQTGKKTLGEVFQEQDQLIQKIAEEYQRGVNTQGVQDSQVEMSRSVENESDYYQGVQDSPLTFSNNTVQDSLLDRSRSLDSLLDIDQQSPQGIQGDNCERFQLWQENCAKYGFTNCNQQLKGFLTGRQTLGQIFQKQEALIQEIADYWSIQQQQRRSYSTSPGDEPKPSGAEVSGQESQLSQRQKLQRAVKEYGATVIVFHVGISLMSLGGFYLAVDSGIDMVGLLSKIGVGEGILKSKLATGTSTFVVAYAVHKVFAPVRIAITLTSTPFIVRYLRRIGFLKPPKVKPS